MKRNWKIAISILSVLAWMCIVFYFSHQPSEVSSRTSGGMIQKMIHIFAKDIDILQEEALIENLQNVVRKTAHFMIYTFGGILIYHMMKAIKTECSQKPLWILKHLKLSSIIIGAIYASSDEIHQLWISGRSGELRDVCIDTCGVIVGVYICFIGMKMINNKIKKTCELDEKKTDKSKIK